MSKTLQVRNSEELCEDITAFEREADRAFNGWRDFYVVRALCIVARELRLLCAGVKP